MFLWSHQQLNQIKYDGWFQPCSSLIFFPSSPCYPLDLQLYFHADWLPMIRAWQPIGLSYWSLLTAAYLAVLWFGTATTWTKVKNAKSRNLIDTEKLRDSVQLHLVNFWCEAPPLGQPVFDGARLNVGHRNVVAVVWNSSNWEKLMPRMRDIKRWINCHRHFGKVALEGVIFANRQKIKREIELSMM